MLWKNNRISSFIKDNIIPSDQYIISSLYMLVGGHLYSLAIVNNTAENMGIKYVLKVVVLSSSGIYQEEGLRLVNLCF